MNFVKCTICAKCFPKHTALDLHMMIVHGETEHKKLARTQKIVQDEADKKKINAKVNIEEKFQCSDCDFKSSNNDDLESHMVNVHVSNDGEQSAKTKDIKIEFGDEEDENILPPQYTTKSYPKYPDDPTQISHKSIQKSLLFGKATENLGKIFKKNAKIMIDKTKATVKDYKGKTDTRLEATVEITDDDGSGCARVTIWGPKLDGKKKDCTVQICKMEGQPVVAVKILNEMIVKPLLVNSDTKNAIKSLAKANTNIVTDREKEDEEESSKLKCDPCKKEFINVRTMRKHKRERNSKVKFNQDILPGLKRKKETKAKINSESPPRKLRVMEPATEEEPNAKENKDYSEDNMDVDQISIEDKINKLQKVVEKLKTKQIEDEHEKSELKKTIKKLTSKSNDEYNTTPTDSMDKIKPVNEDHIPFLKGFKWAHRGIPSGACLTFCTAVPAHDDENQGTIVKMKVNHQMADIFDGFYVNEIGLPYTETIGVGRKRRTITCNTAEGIKDFFRNPLSGSLEVFTNQAEIKAIANLYQINIHIFTYGRPGCEPAWSMACPDPDREFEAEFPKGSVQDMHLYHEFDNHYDLLVDDDKIKRLSEEVNVEETQSTSKTDDAESSWTTIKKQNKYNKTGKGPTYEDDEEFLSLKQREREIIHRNKNKGFRRTDPMTEPIKVPQTEDKNNLWNQCNICKVRLLTEDLLHIHMMNHIPLEDEEIMKTTEAEPNNKAQKQTNEDKTLCTVCKLRCSSKKKLETHMKNHTGDDTYDMSLLQDAIKLNKGTGPSYQCTKCKEEFKDKHNLRKHIKSNHPNFKPCNAFSAGKTCDFGSKCDYNHIIIAEGTFICWDCGQLFNNKIDLMVHRKKTYGVNIICGNSLKEPVIDLWRTVGTLMSQKKTHRPKTQRNALMSQKRTHQPKAIRRIFPSLHKTKHLHQPH